MSEFRIVCDYPYPIEQVWRVLTEPGVRAEVAELARRIGRIRPLPARALEFEKERALRLLNLAPGRTPPTRAGGSRRSAHLSTRP